MEWQPIETAPKDGRKILICDGNDVFQAEWCRVFYDWLFPLSDMDGCSIGGRSEPTHWMPLPEMPE